MGRPTAGSRSIEAQTFIGAYPIVSREYVVMYHGTYAVIALEHISFS
jgi:hypothetical protein